MRHRFALTVLLSMALTAAADTDTDAPPPTGGEAYFAAEVLPELMRNGCAACHMPGAGYVRPAIEYGELLPYLAMGRGRTDNVLIYKLANLKSIDEDRPAHIGGQRCESPESEPCARIMGWWTAEFGEAKADGTALRAIPVERTPPPDLPRHPIGDSPQGEILAGNRPTAALHEYFRSQDGEFRVEYSEYDEMTARLIDWPGDEFIVLLEGAIEVTDSDGNARVYRAGDMLVLPKGFNGTWRQVSPIRKVSVSYGWYTED